MMSVKEYAQDVNKTVSEILKICKTLNLSIDDENYMLSDDEIILLDGELDNGSEEEFDEIIDEELEEDLGINTDPEDTTVAKMKKPKEFIPKSSTNNTKKYQTEKKEIYKHKEKLITNEEDDNNVVLFENNMTIKDFAEKLEISPLVLLKKLMDLGIMTNINQTIDFATAEIIALDYEKVIKQAETRDIANFEKYEIIDKDEDLLERPPVVTIMGHVDHGKTSLLDAVRETHVVDKESGGITQHIGAYQVKINDNLITFIDTPGHAAFTEMRARGASVTDIVVIIVAADDGVKPQTIEAIDHAKAAGVPIIVAINKIDLPNANPDRVLQEMTQYGLTPEEWGGDILVNRISAKTKEGIKELLENIVLVAEMKELKANPNRYATGSVIEARLDKNIGSICTLLIQNGTLRLGDPIVIGNIYGKVRTLKNDLGKNIISALPSTPVEVTGLNELPTAGDRFMSFETEKEARKIADERSLRSKEANTNRTGMTLEDLFSQIQAGTTKKINVILKTDVKGSEEAIKNSLAKIDVQGVKVDVIRSGTGTISESDVVLAGASDAIIIRFNVRPNSKTVESAKEHKVDIRLHTIIYKIIEELELAMLGMLDPEFAEKILGQAEVRQLFKFSKVGIIAGSIVTDGVIKKDTKARVIRDGVVVYDGKIESLQREKDKTNEVKKGIECGITLDNYNDLKERDLIESYIVEEVKR